MNSNKSSSQDTSVPKIITLTSSEEAILKKAILRAKQLGKDLTDTEITILKDKIIKKRSNPPKKAKLKLKPNTGKTLAARITAPPKLKKKKGVFRKKKVKIKKAPKRPKIDLKKIAEKNLEVLVKSLSDCRDPIIKDDSFNDRVDLDQWVLPNRKDFPNYLNVFSEAVSKSQRTPLKVWNNNSNEYNDITPFDHKKFVSDYISDKSQ